MAEKLTKEQRTAALQKLSGWRDVAGRDAIARKFTFKDFNEAFGFMARVALIAEKTTLPNYNYTLSYAVRARKPPH